jgi:hypothetical protein
MFEQFFDDEDVARFKRLSKSAKHEVAAAALKALEIREIEEKTQNPNFPFGKRTV